MSMPKDAKHDFYAIITGEIAPCEYGLSDAELWPEAVFFIAAGGATVHTAMTAAFFYLSRHSSAYARLANEIRNTFTSIWYYDFDRAPGKAGELGEGWLGRTDG
ncbi:hypothetical protein F5Y10DRAFT_266946 [Nemania abortiva]|nr:hypothetical protein F5Y10DRAFT_266946 [Nemania abortiva]